MFITSLEIENWKCYLKKTRFSFNQFELINQRNGTGKTSLFEAIIFAIWGKTPPGFNMNSVRNDENKICTVSIWFDMAMDGTTHEFHIVRQFAPSTAVLYIDNEVRYESIRTIDDYMNSIMDYKIVSQLWTNSLIENSISTSTFFKNTLLENVLRDPLTIRDELKRRIYQNNRAINAFHQDENLSDVEGIKKKMDSLQKRLKKNVPVDIAKARAAKDAADKLKKLKPQIESLDTQEYRILYSKLINVYNHENEIRKAYEAELHKTISLYSAFNERVVSSMLKDSEKRCSCALCHRDISASEVEKLQYELASSGRSDEKIKIYENDLSYIEKYSKDIIPTLKEYIECIDLIERCPDYDRMIKEYDADNKENWKKFNELQDLYAKAVAQREKANEINALKVENESNSKKLDVVTNYIENAGTYYMQNILAKASEYLQNINSRYQQIYEYDGAFHVLTESTDVALNLLPIVRLSNGEKTMCALCILIAVHNLMLPDLPLLFDETFAALDHENLYAIQSFLKKIVNTQIFVITHDMSWKEG